MCKFAIRIILYIKAPLPHYAMYTTSCICAIDSTFTNTSLCFANFIHWRVLFARERTLFSAFDFVITIHCVGEGFLRFEYILGWYTEILFSSNLYIHLHYWHGFFIPNPHSGHCHSHMCDDCEFRAIHSTVCWFRHFSAPLICLIRRNSTHAYECLCVCVCEREWVEFQGTISHLKIAPLIF